jgi:site-specific recombinase XerD
MRAAKIQAKSGTWSPKNLSERTIPLSAEAMEVITELYKERSGPWVFGAGDKPMKDIRRSLSTAAKNAGITKRITPVMLRHTFATHLFMNGADASAVQELMGHTSLDTTTRYTHNISQNLRDTVGKLDKTCHKVAI